MDIYYDSWNDWLFADWRGELTLAAVQTACLHLTQCLLKRPYAHVLNSNAQVTTAQWEVAGWLAQDFLPSLALACVEKLAWVCSPNLRSRNIAHTVLHQVPQLRLALFDELDEAVDWLQQNRQDYVSGCGLPLRRATDQARLEQAAQALAHALRQGPPVPSPTASGPGLAATGWAMLPAGQPHQLPGL